MYLTQRRPLFTRRSETNIYRMFFICLAILFGIWLLRGLNTGAISPIAQVPPTPTRTAGSYQAEGQANFAAGKLDAAVQAYRDGLALDPNNARGWAELARIQAYSSALLTTDGERVARLGEALESADRANELAPDDSTVAAIRAFVLDWNSNYVPAAEASVFLTQAEQEAVRALQLDNTNTLALAYYAEILIDQQKLAQGALYIEEALQRDQSIMDVHRIYAYSLESQQQYRAAIEAYDRAIAINPNLTFLYLRAGAIYRHLQDYETALEYFAKAVRINEQIGVEDPIPYLSISRTYSQMGEFYAASLNVQRAIDFNPANPDVYGQLGIVYFKSRNYEGAIPALKCALRGCTPEESCDARGGCNPGQEGFAVQGLPLTQGTLVYYYTYGSVLAALSRPQQNYCGDAMQVFSEVRAGGYTSEPTVLGIVQAGEAICASLGTTSASAPQATPTLIPSTPTPSP